MKRAVALTIVLLLLPVAALAQGYDAFRPAADAALGALTGALDAMQKSVYVYRDSGDTENHFTQKAKMAGLDGSLVLDMDENWRDDPHGGESCIRCRQTVSPVDWGGWLFLNGWLAEGESVPRLNDGTMDNQGLDLTGAQALSFWARGERGGETVEFFTCGFGYDGQWGARIAPYPDSAGKRSLGYIELEQEWREYTVDLADADMRYVVCGFGYVLSGEQSNMGDNAFYLDDIRFNGDFSGRDAHCMLRSYDTDNLYIQNAAFSYDNALAVIKSMYDVDKRVFYTGTLDDGATPSADNLVLDAQVWACMALGEAFEPCEASLQTVAAMRTPEGGYPFCAANANGGWWAEGTAYTALMYRLRGEDEAAADALAALKGIQLESGLFPAATVDSLSAGFGLFDGSPWEYGTAPHIAPTAWFVMAVNGFNPYAF